MILQDTTGLWFWVLQSSMAGEIQINCWLLSFLPYLLTRIPTYTHLCRWMTFCPEWLTGSPNLNTSNFLYLWVYLVVRRYSFLSKQYVDLIRWDVDSNSSWTWCEFFSVYKWNIWDMTTDLLSPQQLGRHPFLAHVRLLPIHRQSSAPQSCSQSKEGIRTGCTFWWRKQNQILRRNLGYPTMYYYLFVYHFAIVFSTPVLRNLQYILFWLCPSMRTREHARSWIIIPRGLRNENNDRWFSVELWWWYAPGGD